MTTVIIQKLKNHYILIKVSNITFNFENINKSASVHNIVILFDMYLSQLFLCIEKVLRVAIIIIEKFKWPANYQGFHFTASV